jgi:hypothetical protein
MKWCRFQSGAVPAYGIIEGDSITGKEMFTDAVKDAIVGIRQFISRMSQYLTLTPATCRGWAPTAPPRA